MITYDNDYSFSLLFYTELQQWWSELHDNFASTEDWVSMMWNNKDSHVNDGAVLYENFFKGGVVFVDDLTLNFHLNNTDSFKIIDNVFDVTKKKSKHSYSL